MGIKVLISRVDTAANFTSANPVLSLGEMALEQDTGQLKVGDGATAWNTLGYLGGGGGVTDHGALTGLGDDDHIQYLNITRHAAIGSNPHGVNATQVGLGNVPNVDATQRSNHSGTQLAATISNFDTAVQNNANVIANTAKISFPEAPNDGNYYARRNQTWESFTPGGGGPTPVFGTEFEDFLDTSNTNITTGTLFAVRTFTTQSKPSGRYRIAMEVQLKPGSASNNYLFQLRVNGVQIGLKMEEEGKDTGSDQRHMRSLVGYHDHVGPGTFDIQLFGARQGGTLVLHGVLAEVWRVS